MPKQTATLITGLCLLVAMAARADSLTSQTVSRFLASMEALRASESFSEHFMSAWKAGREGREFPGSLMPSGLLAVMEDREGYGAFVAIIAAHGFDRPQAWSQAGDRALLALMSLDLQDKVPVMQARLQRLRQQVSANSRFSDAQKRKIQQMIESSSHLFERVAQVPDADRNAVRPHRAALKDAMDYQSAR